MPSHSWNRSVVGDARPSARVVGTPPDTVSTALTSVSDADKLGRILADILKAIGRSKLHAHGVVLVFKMEDSLTAC